MKKLALAVALAASLAGGDVCGKRKRAVRDSVFQDESAL